MNILITGGKGMLGRTLIRHWQGAHTCIVADLPEADITNRESIAAAVAAAKADAVVHCAAMTAVDACEDEMEKAFRINAIGTANVAYACKINHARLIAISTDYVFAGDLDRPYIETDRPAPRTLYGLTKLSGEDAIRTILPGNHIIARIAWLYGFGGPSFVHTMLKLAAQDPARTLNVVNDQIGNPTSTAAVAAGLTAILARPELSGTFHLTCEGEATWYEFAKAIFEEAGYPDVKARPCTTAEYPRPAPRPANSRLEKAALRAAHLPPMPHWRDALKAFLKDPVE